MSNTYEDQLFEHLKSEDRVRQMSQERQKLSNFDKIRMKSSAKQDSDNWEILSSYSAASSHHDMSKKLDEMFVLYMLEIDKRY
jgi:hypothetical protein